MHSSEALQGSSFELTVNGQLISHADFFRGVTMCDRLALYTPGRIEGAGAINLLMAYVTAFYDDYRATGEPFFAYPEFFALYCGDGALPSYGMFDIYPDHKIVRVGPQPIDVLRAVTDRGANVLLLPDREVDELGTPGEPWVPGEDGLKQLAMASARRNIKACYAYSFSGQVRDPDVTVVCDARPFIDWVKTLVDSVSDDAQAEAQGKAWLEQFADVDKLVQSYRRMELDEALGLL